MFVVVAAVAADDVLSFSLPFVCCCCWLFVFIYFSLCSSFIKLVLFRSLARFSISLISISCQSNNICSV